MLFDPYALLPPMGWLVFSIVATSLWSLLIRVLNKGEEDYLASVATTDSLSASMLIFVIAILGIDFGLSAPFDFSAVPLHFWAFVFVGSLLYAGFIFYTFKGSQHVEAAVRPVLSQSQSTWAVLIAFIFLGEIFSPQKLFALALIVTGCAVSIWRPHKMNFVSKGVGTILFASFLIGVASVLDKVILEQIPAMLYPIFTFSIPAIIFIFLLGKSGPSRIKKIITKNFAVCILISSFAILSFISLLLALAKLEASLTIPLFNTFVILSSLGAMIFLNEKEARQYKIAGAILAFVGAILIS